MTTLSRWQPHPTHPQTEVRVTVMNIIVMSLFPEGRTGSTCWVWHLKPHDCLPMQYPHGSHLDREECRKLADLAAIGYGYNLLP